MLNFNFARWYSLIILLTLFSANKGFTQNTGAPLHTMVSGAVVNLTDIANHELLHPVQTQVQENMLQLPQQENLSIRLSQNKTPANGTARSISDSLNPSPSPLANFVAQFYDEYFPGCPSGAVNESYVVSVSRFELVVQNRTGTILNQVNIYDLWSNAFPIGNIWDDLIDYDPGTKRWIICGNSDRHTDTAGVLVGISQTDDPRGNWNLYKVRADSSGQTFPSFPTLGFNKNWIAVSGTTVLLNGNAEDSVKIFLFDKNQIMNGSGANCTVFNLYGAKISLAATYDTLTNYLYMMSEWENTIGQLLLQEISGSVGTEALTTVAYPTSSVPYGNGAPNGENFAPQMGSSFEFQVGDDRPVSLVYVNGYLWCAQGISLPAGNPTRSSVQWWQIDTTGNVIQLGLVDDTTGNLFYAYPSIAAIRITML